VAPLVVGAVIAVMVIFREPPPPPPAPPPVPKPAARLPVETVVVLPGADGRVGTVIVERGDARQVLDRAFASSRVVGEAAPQPGGLSEAEVRERFAGTLRALPARPASFLLYFVTGRDELTAESNGELQRVLADLRSRPVPDVIVIGHTDTVGSTDANDRLSVQRAERVKGFLVGIGIAPERIQIAGRGERELLVPTADNVAEARNRRVEINVR
jgi:outer membrane protein OmpA-like peptidoglycan-associated protein